MGVVFNTPGSLEPILLIAIATYDLGTLFAWGDIFFVTHLEMVNQLVQAQSFILATAFGTN